jgi:hypothetical protein
VRKIHTLFLRDWDGNPKYVTREPNPECGWVFAGEGEPTVKWDGICVGYLNLGLPEDEPVWVVRREIKPGKPYPTGAFWLSGEDSETGKKVGWVPAKTSGYAKYIEEARAVSGHDFAKGTYELVGPKVNGNPDKFAGHLLIRHGWAPLRLREDAKTAPRDYDGLAKWLHAREQEGIVWHHPDGRMAKIKAMDFPKEAL